MDSDILTPEHLLAVAKSYGSDPLLVLPGGREITLAEGYISIDVNFTLEDKAAKGLRKGKIGDAVEPPVYFSALETIRSNQVLLLTGPSGSGKTTIGKHLAFSLAKAEDAHLPNTVPYYFPISGSESFSELLDNVVPHLIRSFKTTNANLCLILDNVNQLGADGSLFLAEIVRLVRPLKSSKVLFWGDSTVVKEWHLIPDIVRHELRPLSEGQRRQVISSLTECVSSEVSFGLGAAAAHPIYFALALEAKHVGDEPERLLDSWLDIAIPEKQAQENLAAEAFGLCNTSSLNEITSPKLTHTLFLSSKAVQRLLAARYLINQPPHIAIHAFQRNPYDFETIIRSLLARLSTTDKELYLRELLKGSKVQTQFGALVVCDFVSEYKELEQEIINLMQAIVQEGTLSIIQREKAGRVLARLGDPRDLTALARIPAGDFVLGSDDFPNSQPPSKISLNGFQIGVYPVVNQDYSLFIQETKRTWQSADGTSPETQNAPATDLTWYDANAYCEWLTPRWRASGKIGNHEYVRLPSEPEWERAARGDILPAAEGATIYPWGTEWKHDAANYEETGFNSRLPVGLFPAGRSPYGCYDMAGQVWEWCATLWGEDMTTPYFRYPWKDDGRENLEASGSIRRVLRGGCFSSGRLKASCTYRGSLEPAGFWRGNGFRVVVAPVPS